MDMLKAVNWPDMLTRMCKEVAGFTSAESFGLNLLSIKDKKGLEAKLHDYVSDSDLDELKVIDKKYNAGHTILMMIDSNMIYDKISYNPIDITKNSHWVVYEGGLQLFDDTGNLISNLRSVKYIKFKIYTWGEDIKNSRLIKLNINKGLIVESFKSNYYGYIEVC
ncbi:hypothetical protein [Flavobacterium ginsengiterrae]|uniref:Uncharacterized protein n=1 Tax=Flavobacterium ginsengiterrae TaxID=871695 RepID=A0ABP7H7R0_9FLAO